MKKPPLEKRQTEIEKVLQPIIDAEAYQKSLKELVDIAHLACCPMLTQTGLCTCPDDSPSNLELKELAMGFARTHMSSATDAERVIFAYVLLHTLEKAWRIGHKWFADSDPKLREKADALSKKICDASGFTVDECSDWIFDLVKEVEDQAWMRLSSARTKQWNTLEELLGVQGGQAVVDAVKKLKEDLALELMRKDDNE